MNWRIAVDLTYESKDICIHEFERIVADLKDKGYSKGVGGTGKNFYLVKGPDSLRFTDEEIIKLREFIKDK